LFYFLSFSSIFCILKIDVLLHCFFVFLFGFVFWLGWFGVVLLSLFYLFFFFFVVVASYFNVAVVVVASAAAAVATSTSESCFPAGFYQSLFAQY
jgi:hypothetical protein